MWRGEGGASARMARNLALHQCLGRSEGLGANSCAEVIEPHESRPFSDDVARCHVRHGAKVHDQADTSSSVAPVGRRAPGHVRIVWFSSKRAVPRKPVPMVMDGARNVSNPAAPVEQPTLMATRSTSISAANLRITAGSAA